MMHLRKACAAAALLLTTVFAAETEKPSPFRYRTRTTPKADSEVPPPKSRPPRKPSAAENTATGNVGIASFHGSAKQSDPDAPLTAAHLTLPIGSRVQVTNLGNGKSAVVTITSRGPFGEGRIISVNRRAAEQLGFVQAGITRVRIDRASGE
jgi:rare lipoprotein A (peptidoglycan hydrolase)